MSVSKQNMSSTSLAENYRAAISILEDSTQAINNYRNASQEILETSQKVRQTVPSDRNVSKVADRSQRQPKSQSIEAARLNITNALRTGSENVQRAITLALITTDDTLSRHDHHLANIDREINLASEAKLGDDGDEYSQKLLDALQHTHAEIIRTRLNRKYLESLGVKPAKEPQQPRRTHNGDSSEAKAELVKADLRTLYSEINDVAQMLIMHDHGDQLNIVNENLRSSKAIQQQQATQQASEQISSMTTQLESIAEHVEFLQSQRLLQQKFEEHLAVIKPVDTIEQKPIGYVTSESRLDHPSTSLKALAQYLGFYDGQLERSNHSLHVDSLFESLIKHINATLAIQTEQNDLLPGKSKNGQSPEGWSNVAGHATLNELDNDIARIKTKLEKITDR